MNAVILAEITKGDIGGGVAGLVISLAILIIYIGFAGKFKLKKGFQSIMIIIGLVALIFSILSITGTLN